MSPATPHIPADGDAALRSELDEHLAAWERSSSWRAVRTLKESDFELTEVVRFEGAGGGSLGPFVRKTIDCSAGVGTAYERLLTQQRAGFFSPHLPRIVECSRMGERLTVVMEWIDGVDLGSHIAQEGPGMDRVREIVPALCDAASFLHERLDPPLIHRDLKPSNIIVRGGVPIVIDFGISRTWREDAEADTTHFGTRSYAPPEQFGFGQTDVRSDVFALGGLVFFCLTGGHPHGAMDRVALEGEGVPRALAGVIERARRFDPKGRYATASELKAALMDALSMCSDAPSQAKAHTMVASSADLIPAPSRAALPDPASTPPDFGARGARRSLGEIVPVWVGVMWNVALAILLSLVLVTSVVATLHPNARDAALPLWFRALEYLVMLDASWAIITYLLLDRRRLRKRFPLLARWGVLRETAVGLAAVFAIFALTTIVYAAAGLG